MIVKLLNMIRHPRDDEGDFGVRAIQHVIVGLLIGVPLLGYPLLKLFIRYEENEDKHVKDEAWKDYFGAMVGAAITEVAIVALIAWRLT